LFQQAGDWVPHCQSPWVGLVSCHADRHLVSWLGKGLMTMERGWVVLSEPCGADRAA
jgi:hypothetical protein